MTMHINTFQAASLCEDRIFYQASETRIAKTLSTARKAGLQDSVCRATIMAEIDGLIHCIHSYLQSEYPNFTWSLNRYHLLTKLACSLGFENFAETDKWQSRKPGSHYAAWSHE